MAYSLLSFLADGPAGVHSIINDIADVARTSAQSTASGAGVVLVSEGGRVVADQLGLKILDRATGLIGEWNGGGKERPFLGRYPCISHCRGGACISPALGSALTKSHAARAVDEHIPSYVKVAMKLMYHSVFGKRLTSSAPIRAALKAMSAREG
jgi:hypothetical protein